LKLRSLLFVPADRPERLAKAAASGADALIIDLEDSVAAERKDAGLAAIAEWLTGDRAGVTTFVRVNPLDSGPIYTPYWRAGLTVSCCPRPKALQVSKR
jgi:citrate lyase subunit beta/citryl-CoA lyase